VTPCQLHPAELCCTTGCAAAASSNTVALPDPVSTSSKPPPSAADPGPGSSSSCSRAGRAAGLQRVLPSLGLFCPVGGPQVRCCCQTVGAARPGLTPSRQGRRRGDHLLMCHCDSACTASGVRAVAATVCVMHSVATSSFFHVSPIAGAHSETHALREHNPLSC